MSDSTIGIKLADGSYYPIINEEDAPKRRKLVLTTAHDDQTNVQIDLFRGEGSNIKDALYIGSLFIENIEMAEKGEPDIDLVLELMVKETSKQPQMNNQAVKASL